MRVCILYSWCTDAPSFHRIRNASLLLLLWHSPYTLGMENMSGKNVMAYATYYTHTTYLWRDARKMWDSGDHPKILKPLRIACLIVYGGCVSLFSAVYMKYLYLFSVHSAAARAPRCRCDIHSGHIACEQPTNRRVCRQLHLHVRVWLLLLLDAMKCIKTRQDNQIIYTNVEYICIPNGYSVHSFWRNIVFHFGYIHFHFIFIGSFKRQRRQRRQRRRRRQGQRIKNKRQQIDLQYFLQ